MSPPQKAQDFGPRSGRMKENWKTLSPANLVVFAVMRRGDRIVVVVVVARKRRRR